MTHRTGFVALLTALVTASSLVAATPAPSEVLSIVRLGGRLVVDSRFDVLDVLSFLSVAPDRVTVVSDGFTREAVAAMRTAGAGLVLDASFDPGTVVQLAGQGVLVDPAGFDPDTLRAVIAKGASLMVGTGGATFAEKLLTVRGGGQAVVDRQFTYAEVATLIADGGSRVHVMGKGFAPEQLLAFVRGQAIVWVDATTPAPEVTKLVDAGGVRVVVKGAGFAVDALQRFAARGAQVIFALDQREREAKRSAKFNALHGE